MTRPLSKHILSVSQACRDEIAELGEIGAPFLALWPDLRRGCLDRSHVLLGALRVRPRISPCCLDADIATRAGALGLPRPAQRRRLASACRNYEVVEVRPDPLTEDSLGCGDGHAEAAGGRFQGGERTTRANVEPSRGCSKRI